MDYTTCLLFRELRFLKGLFATLFGGWGNSIMVSVSVCEVGRPGSSPARSVCISQKGGDLPACYQLVPTSAEDWFNKGHAMCNHVYVIMHVKDS